MLSRHYCAILGCLLSIGCSREPIVGEADIRAQLEGLCSIEEVDHRLNFECGYSMIEDEDLGVLRHVEKEFDLDLEGTDISDVGLELLSSSKSIRSLDLADTGITNQGIAHVAMLKSLESINLRGTAISSLENLGELQNLNTLELPEHLNRDSFSIVARLLRLRWLTINSNVSVHNFRKLDKLKELKGLYIFSSSLSNESIEQISALTPIENLYLVGFSQPAADIRPLLKLNQLKRLMLSIPVRDDQCEVLSGFSNLTYLDLRHSPITDVGLAKLHSLDKLTEINLVDTDVTGNGVRQFQEELPDVKVVWSVR